MQKPTKAIILIAGLGSRLRPLTDTQPKCLTEVNGTPILMNALNQLNEAGIKETILVIGYLGEKVREAVGNSFKSMKISYAENPDYNKTNNSYSLWVAIKGLPESLLILEGDVFFEKKLLQALMEDKRENVTTVEKYNPNLDGTFVEVSGNSLVKSWVHKKERPEGFTLEDKYKTINIHKFSEDFVKETIIPTLKQHIDETGGTEPIEYIFKTIIKDGGEIWALDAKGIKWFEIDEVEELKIAEEMFKDV